MQFDFTLDLTADEMRRRAEVVKALGPDWDPIAAMHDEERAHELLYSNLDAEQQATFDMLVAEGVLPDRSDRDAA